MFEILTSCFETKFKIISSVYRKVKGYMTSSTNLTMYSANRGPAVKEVMQKLQKRIKFTWFNNKKSHTSYCFFFKESCT